jgi:hypothetical protein
MPGQRLCKAVSASAFIYSSVWNGGGYETGRLASLGSPCRCQLPLLSDVSIDPVAAVGVLPKKSTSSNDVGKEEGRLRLREYTYGEVFFL